jgi:hypothetical protein
MITKTNTFSTTKSTPAKTVDAVNVAARYFVYKLYEATDAAVWLGTRYAG